MTFVIALFGGFVSRRSFDPHVREALGKLPEGALKDDNHGHNYNNYGRGHDRGNNNSRHA